MFFYNLKWISVLYFVFYFILLNENVCFVFSYVGYVIKIIVFYEYIEIFFILGKKWKVDSIDMKIYICIFYGNF